MLRTIAVLCTLIYAVCFFPFWATIALFAFSLTVLVPRLLLFVPALLYDVLYAPHSGPWYTSFLMTLGVAVALFAAEFFIRKTRISEIIYGVEATY